MSAADRKPLAGGPPWEPDLGSGLADAVWRSLPACEGCGAPSSAATVTRPLSCPACAGHWLCQECWDGVWRVRLADPGGPLCEVVDGWRMETELVGAERACRVCGRPGRAPEWACRACRGSHRVCRDCVRERPGVAMDWCPEGRGA